MQLILRLLIHHLDYGILPFNMIWVVRTYAYAMMTSIINGHHLMRSQVHHERADTLPARRLSFTIWLV